jgi:hypothetical protein
MLICLASRDITDIKEGSVIANIPSDWTIGKEETFANGFAWIEIKDYTDADCRRFLNGKLINNEIVGSRLIQISFNTPIPVNKAIAIKKHNLVKGRSIRKHLKNQTIPLNKNRLVTIGN